jgi:hypothetical protein
MGPGERKLRLVMKIQTDGLRYVLKGARFLMSVRTRPEVTRVQTVADRGATFKTVAINHNAALWQ